MAEDAIGCALKYNSNVLMVINGAIPVGYTDCVGKKYGITSIIFRQKSLRKTRALNDNLRPSRVVVSANEDQAEEARMFANLLSEGAVTERDRAGGVTRISSR